MTVSLPTFEGILTRALDAGHVPGASLIVFHEGEVVHQDARGVTDPVTSSPLRADTIFWLASLSKVVCAATVLRQVDAGAIALDDPVSKFVPEFADAGTVRVVAPGSPPVVRSMPFAGPPDPMPVYDLVPAERPLIVRDLLTHTSGLQSIFQYNADYQRPADGDILATYVPTLAKLPRDFQAGTRWAYSNAAAFDVLGRVVEVASGEDFNSQVEALKAGIGITDLGFGLTDSPRAAAMDPRFGADPVMRGDRYFGGAAGMWGSTAHYARFVEMLRNDGRVGETQVLSAGSARALRTNQVGDLCPGLNGRPERGGIGFGLAVAVVTDPEAAGTPLRAGTFGWDGVNTRRFWANVDEQWSAVMYVPHDDVQIEIEAALAETFARS